MLSLGHAATAHPESVKPTEGAYRTTQHNHTPIPIIIRTYLLQYTSHTPTTTLSHTAKLEANPAYSKPVTN